MKFYILAFLLLFAAFSFSLIPGSHPDPETEKAGLAKIVFKSTDGGQTWQDISTGLPENLQKDSIRGNSFFANDNGLFLRVGNGLYQSTPKAIAPFWTAIHLNQDSSMTPGKSGIISYKWGANLKKANGTSIWSPIFEYDQEPRIRSVFETAGGAVFIGNAKGFFKTADDGKTWKHVHTGSLVGHLAESNGVLVAISTGKIIRSTDNGETWVVTASEDDVAFDVKPIKGGFVAITAGSASATRRLSTSYDGGKTWQLVDGLQRKDFSDSIWRTWNDRPHVQAFTTSIIPVSENFLCIHRDGIFRSTDKGKTWKLFLPSVEDKVFSLFVSGDVIYAVAGRPGC